jgi:hypothetical protein
VLYVGRCEDVKGRSILYLLLKLGCSAEAKDDSDTRLRSELFSQFLKGFGQIRCGRNGDL